MNKRVISKSGFGVLAITSLMLLPSCGVIDWVKDKMGGGKSMSSNESSIAADGSAEVASIAGKPLITATRLEKEKKDLIESNPQLKAMISYMDSRQFDRNLTEGLVNQEVVDRYVADNNINQTPEYKQEYERMMKSVRQMLNTKHFSQAFNVAISDADIQKFYDEHKTDMPNIVVSRGGVKAMGVMFESEAAAKEFMNKASGKEFKKVAKEAGLADKVKDFNLVNDQSLGMEPAVREKIVAMKKFPSVDMVKARDKAFWVVTATGKEEPKYREFEQVKAELAEHMKRERRMEVFEAEIQKLKAKYQIAINEEYFKEPAAQPAETMAESAEAKAEPTMQQASTEATAATPETAPTQDAKVA